MRSSAGVGLRVINPLCRTTKKALGRYLRAINQMCLTPNLAQTSFGNLSDNNIVHVSYSLNCFINTIRNHMKTWRGFFFYKDAYHFICIIKIKKKLLLLLRNQRILFTFRFVYLFHIICIENITQQSLSMVVQRISY